jgi:hypothetical protein
LPVPEAAQDAAVADSPGCAVAERKVSRLIPLAPSRKQAVEMVRRQIRDSYER